MKRMAQTHSPRIAVLGAGPIGLEAALYARSLDFPTTIYERGRVGELLRKWGHVRLFSPFSLNHTPLGRAAIEATQPEHDWPADGDCITGREHVTTYLEPLAQTPLLRECLKAGIQVRAVGRQGFLKEEGVGDERRGQQPFRLLLRDSKGSERFEEADVILDCTGTYGQHRWCGDGGIPAAGEAAAEGQIAYTLEDVLGDRQTVYANQTTLVLGAGYSAASTVCDLAKLAEKNPASWIIWAVRRGGTQPLKRIANDPLRERDRLAARANMLATRGEKHVEFHTQTIVDAIELAGPDKGFRVRARSAGKPRTWEVDRIIANVGYAPDTGLYRELQIHECYATQGPMNLAAALAKHAGADCLAVPALGANTLRSPEPNFFILGAKSYGRNSQFLLRNGFEQTRDVFALITGKADLDLYKKR
jgi:thioredoxin reductase